MVEPYVNLEGVFESKGELEHSHTQFRRGHQ